MKVNKTLITIPFPNVLTDTSMAQLCQEGKLAKYILYVWQNIMAGFKNSTKDMTLKSVFKRLMLTWVVYHMWM